jgi:hypothetical protein
MSSITSFEGNRFRSFLEDEAMSASNKIESDQYSAKETKERFETALRGAMSTPAKPLKDKPKAKKSKKKGSDGSRKR